MSNVNEESKLLDVHENDCEVNFEYEVKGVEKSTNNEVEGKTGTFSAVFIVVNAAMGAGLLNIPEAFKNAGGIFPGITLEMCFLILIVGSLMILGYCTHIYKQRTYQEVIETLCGKGVGFVTESFIILYMFGTSIAMIIIVGDQFDKVMEAVNGIGFCHHWYMNRKFTMSVFATGVILPLCIPKDISFLRHASIVGVLATIVVMVTVVIKFATSTYIPGPIRHAPQSTAELLSAVPAIFFAYQCHVSSVPVYASLKKKTASNWAVVIAASLFICSLSYTLTGICGYLTFGDNVKSDILQSYNAKDMWVIAARISIVIAMLTSYPILQFCGRAAFITFFIKLKLFSMQPISKVEKCRRYSITFTWFFASLALALFIPNIGEAIALVGGFAGCFILVFPGLCLTMVAYKLENMPRWKINVLSFIGLFYVAVGTFLFGEITSEAIMNDLHISDPEVSSQCYVM
uniref:Putative sodium-coupled neutral amino acid transporter 7 n=1 Tax=Phallusia mammillata TaxID=59560 RepID=A0A6F9DSZ8_9ASCI|nr:putative sodium-coupled neutral amino acid transporter 7 [Phallusia mammillata]